jgi:hypothetical protein
MSTLHSRLSRIALQELAGQAYVTVEDQALAMAAAILNNAEGYAVVELPEPLPGRVTGEFPRWELAGAVVLADMVFNEVLCEGISVGPSDARGIAARLIAAADAIEAGA